MAQCEICGIEMAQGRGRARRTCSGACRQAAHRRRWANQLTELRAAAEARQPATTPPAPTQMPAPDDSPAGRIRAVGLELAAAVEAAARRADKDWDTRDAVPGVAGTTPDANAHAVRILADKVAAAILSSAPTMSRNEPEPPAPQPATDPGPSRNKRPETVRPASRKRLSEKAARVITDTAQLVKAADHRDTSRWNVVADDGTILGHVEPSYGGTGRSGRNGWNYHLEGSHSPVGPHKTRKAAAVQCTLSWIRFATAPVRRTLTGT